MKNNFTTEFDHPTRGLHFQVANEEMSTVRLNEIHSTLDCLNANKGEKILDFGAGSGILSTAILKAVGNQGLVHAADPSANVLSKLKSINQPENVSVDVLDSDGLPYERGSFDAVVSLANFHHVPDKAYIFEELARVLVPRGRLIIADVPANSPLQKYFDGPIDRTSSTGHQHEFLGEEDARRLSAGAGFDSPFYRTQSVPWQFNSREDASWFIHRIHDAQCAPAESYRLADEFLGFFHSDGFLMLNWELFFFTAIKLP